MTVVDEHYPHTCTECGGTTHHHRFLHEERGDLVTAWCDYCEADRECIIGEITTVMPTGGSE
ncbi:hypothetical protein [Haloplanus salinarum]|uniref:hypothetical protein n=1 Tax=Haloplanus salinarum TaxID=1912324 RepID=UPI00214C397C|nr:hypothetical protein [Haloplanus salinarum]